MSTVSTMTSLTSPAWEECWHPLREEWIIIAAHRQNRESSQAEDFRQ